MPDRLGIFLTVALKFQLCHSEDVAEEMKVGFGSLLPQLTLGFGKIGTYSRTSASK
jgi:hypothetical protein